MAITDAPSPSGPAAPLAAAGRDALTFEELAVALDLRQPIIPAPVKLPGDGVRVGAPVAETDLELGPLVELPGTWTGSGFNLIARPDKQENMPFFLELNATREILSFTPISGAIPNRGSAQDDISFLGLTYVQQVNDSETNGGLHIEPGIWINVPETSVPPSGPTVVRMATIPHGNALLAQGVSSGTANNGAPTIPTVNSLPVRVDHKPLPLGYTDPFLNASPPPGIDPRAVTNPSVVLEDVLATQKAAGLEVVSNVAIVISTAPAGGIENMPFLVANANATSMTALFWIETVKRPDNTTFLQFQYLQIVTLEFLEINWPHIQVATLVKF